MDDLASKFSDPYNGSADLNVANTQVPSYVLIKDLVRVIYYGPERARINHQLKYLLILVTQKTVNPLQQIVNPFLTWRCKLLLRISILCLHLQPAREVSDIVTSPKLQVTVQERGEFRTSIFLEGSEGFHSLEPHLLDCFVFGDVATLSQPNSTFPDNVLDSLILCNIHYATLADINCRCIFRSS
jgi:hypothetical protein